MNNLKNPYPDIKLFMCCRNELLYLLDKQDKTLSLQQYNKKQFAYTFPLLEIPKQENPVFKFSLSEFKEKKDKILIIRRCGRLGDIFMYRMLFEDIKKMFPDKKLYFACPSEYHGAVKNHPYLDFVIDSYCTDDFIYHYEPLINEQNMVIHKSDYWAECCGFKLKNHNLHMNGNQGCGVLVAPFSRESKRSISDLQILKGLPLIHDKQVEDLNIKICHDVEEIINYVNNFETIISVDTSILHIAAGLGKNVIGLFGHSDGELICKYYSNVKIESIQRIKEIIHFFFG